MITKFKSVRNLAVFQNFNWDNEVVNTSGTPQKFNKINIIYGRNYSGKTTLSRIARALEKGQISEKYENPQFEVLFTDGTISTLHNLNSHGKKIRVFNEDFIKENLRFITNPDDSIAPFAILGGNATIEAEIADLKLKLGSKEEGNETGIYLEQKNALSIANNAKREYDSAKSALDSKLTNKVTDRETGIKYNSDQFGDINYNVTKLRDEIKKVLDPSFKLIPENEKEQKLTLIKETINKDINSLPKYGIDLKSVLVYAEKLVTKQISSSDKIEQLVKDSVMNRWVKDGKSLHKQRDINCSFCGNEISADRWLKLDSHFDEESEKLELELDKLINDLKKQLKLIDDFLPIYKLSFYSKYHKEVEDLIVYSKVVKDLWKGKLNFIIEQLQSRKDNILNRMDFIQIDEIGNELEDCWITYENLRNQANSYSKYIENEQTEAKRQLRLREVFNFARDIQFIQAELEIERLKINFDKEIINKNEVDLKIKNLVTLINDKERLMNDEEKGALKVNEYLNNFFGHDFLTLQALEESNQLDGKKIRFEIIRNNKKAHHLSEGECSLVAFCYFMAKLDDIETSGHKPVIWIDDPISSLDSNHIFFVYSLINAEIVGKAIFEQLFVSTHNLDFLKYLKRLPDNNSTERFIIVRDDKISHIRIMPNYLKDYITEFNFLFHQIYICAKSDLTDGSNFSVYYNFGNNARKFLEALLFYKYPSRINNRTQHANSNRLLKYFGNNNQATILTDRVNNELSHLEEIFDRGMLPIDIPEMKKVAQFILDKIKENDQDQYEALLESIGESQSDTSPSS